MKRLRCIHPSHISEVGEKIDPKVELQMALETVDKEFAEKEARRTAGNEENFVTSQHGNRPEQDNDERAQSWQDDGGRVATDTTGGVEADRDRSDIRVYEEGLASSRNEYSEHSERARRDAEAERLIGIARQNGQYFSPVSDSGDVSVVVGDAVLVERVKALEALLAEKNERINELKERINELKEK